MVTMGTGTFRGPATRRSGRVGLTSFTPASIVGKLVGNLLMLSRCFGALRFCSPRISEHFNESRESTDRRERRRQCPRTDISPTRRKAAAHGEGSSTHV
jgi:hypothetical protein